jgi:hypothetical protein
LIQIIELLTDPLVLIVIAWIIAIGVALVWVRRPRTKIAKVKGPLMKQIGKMIGETEKSTQLSVPTVRSRQDIVTQMFESKMHAIDLEPSTDSGYVPVSHTPLARFLKERGVSDDTIGAILAGLMEEEHEAEVRSIIEAAADSPDVNLIGNELDKAKELAVEEWKSLRESGRA